MSQYGRRLEDRLIITRVRLAALILMLLALLMLAAAAMADDGQITHSAFAGLSGLAAFALWAINDERCRPKIRRLNGILFPWLAKELGVADPGDAKPSGQVGEPP
jgi:hypothetical protein